jgi:hypothetical protein
MNKLIYQKIFAQFGMRRVAGEAVKDLVCTAARCAAGSPH